MHRPKKSLGQNFLKSAHALSAIVATGDIQHGDLVLEVGPGKGALTERLLAVSEKVIAIEKDPELVVYLSEKFAPEIANGKLDLQQGDILEFDPEILRAYGKPYKVIANIPYYITGAIIRQFLEATYLPEKMVLLVQKEVAERVVARDGKESILSVSVKAYATPKYILKVRARDFSPAPKVDSAVLLIENVTRAKLDGIPTERFFELVRAGFAHKRKLLARNLESAAAPEKIQEAFAKLELSPKTRAEDIGPDVWIALSKLLSK